jgi:hypothetical protein
MASVKTVIPVGYYGLGRETWQALSALIARVKVSNPALVGLPKQFGLSRAFGTALDALLAAVSSQDHLQPSQLYDNRNRRYSRDVVATLTQLESRITALGL